MPTTLDDWLVICKTPKQAIEHLRDVRTIEDSIMAKTPYMSSIRKQMGEKYALGHIKMWLIYLQANLNIKNKLDDDMVDLCAETILNDYWSISIGDMKIIVTNALKGHYGEFFESISIPKILSWVDSYISERLNKVAAQSQSENYYHKSEESGWKIGGRTKNYLTDTERSLLK